MTWDPSKPSETRDGREVHWVSPIVDVEGDHIYVTKTDNGRWRTYHVSSDGREVCDVPYSKYDLINIPEFEYRAEGHVSDSENVVAGLWWPSLDQAECSGEMVKNARIVKRPKGSTNVDEWTVEDV